MGRNSAAAKLGLLRTTLISKIQRLGINRGQSSYFRARLSRGGVEAVDCNPGEERTRADQVAKKTRSRPRQGASDSVIAQSESRGRVVEMAYRFAACSRWCSSTRKWSGERSGSTSYRRRISKSGASVYPHQLRSRAGRSPGKRKCLATFRAVLFTEILNLFLEFPHKRLSNASFLTLLRKRRNECPSQLLNMFSHA